MLYRSGTSRGLYFLEQDLPRRTQERDRFLARAMGSGHPQQLDGVGGGNGVTSKAVVVGVDVSSDGATRALTCRTSQCRVLEESVDHSHGDCGNMIAAVLPFAVERGLVSPEKNRTGLGTSVSAEIRSLVTGAVYEASMKMSRAGTGDAESKPVQVAGAPTSGVSVEITTHGVSGAQTGKLLPTGKALDEFVLKLDTQDVTIKASVIDFARVLVILEANDLLQHFGYSFANDTYRTTQKKHWTKATLEADAALNAALEELRQQASHLAGMGDCSNKDAPKLMLVMASDGDAHASAEDMGLDNSTSDLDCRYYANPGRAEVHPTIAMTAAQALGAACLLEGSVANSLLLKKSSTADPGLSESKVHVQRSDANTDLTCTFRFRHERGVFPIGIGFDEQPGDSSSTFAIAGTKVTPTTAKFTTTVKPIFDGVVFVE